MNELKAIKSQGDQQEGYIKNLERQNKEYKTKIASTNTKLNKLKQGKITEFQKKIKDLTSEVNVLKEMVKSSKNEVRSKDISLSSYKKRLTSLEKISKIRSKVSEMHSSHSQNSQRNISNGRVNDTYEYDEHYDDEHETDDVIIEAEENLEHTGNQAQYHNYPPNVKSVQYSKTPNIRVTKNLNNSKISNINKLSPERLKPDSSMPKMDNYRDPFQNKVTKGYDFYKDNLNKADFKNNSYGVKSVFTTGSDQFELPAIKESQGAIIFDRKR